MAMLVVRPEVYSESTAWIAAKVNMICLMRSLLVFGFGGASISRTGRSSGATRSSL